VLRRQKVADRSTKANDGPDALAVQRQVDKCDLLIAAGASRSDFSGGRNRISATACCAQSALCFASRLPGAVLSHGCATRWSATAA
jgi:hypothetical protein